MKRGSPPYTISPPTNGKWQLALVVVLGLGLIACGGGGGGATSLSSNAELPASTGNGNSTVSTVTKVSDMTVGDLYVVPITDGSGTISFTGASSSAEYTLVLQSAVTTGSSSAVVVGNEAVEVDSLAKSIGVEEAGISLDVGDAFDSFLRVSEEELSVSGIPALDSAVTTNKSVAKSVTKTVGDRHSYRVLSSLSSSTSYTTVQGTVVCSSSRLEVVLDDDDTASLTSDEITSLCAKFHDAADLTITTVGDTSDVNGDGRLTVLMTHRVNSLGAQGGGIVTGFFYAADLYPRTSSNLVSNEQEIVYTLVPDPAGSYGTTISKSFAINNLLTAVVPHEIQHAVSYNQHVLVRGGSAEKTWLNEAISHNIECVTGYCQENPSRASLYLASPSNTSLVTSGSASLKQRGASYLFIRYLYEQSSAGSTFLKNMVSTDKADVANIEAAFASTDQNFNQFEEFFLRWGIAVALTNTDVTTDAKYIYKARTYNDATGQWQGVCLQCATEDGRGTTLTGPKVVSYSAGSSVSLAPSAMTHYSLKNQTDAVTLSGTSSAALQAVLIRTK